MYPLVKEAVEEEVKNIDQKIEKAKKYLKELQEIKAQPEKLIKARIGRMLGTTGPQEGLYGELMY